MSLVEFGNPEEFVLPVDYGNLVFKAWGPKTGKPVLGLHGLLDNAGTFDDLVRYLPSTLRFVAPDFSCHGLSSPFPKGIHFCKMMYLLELCRVVKYLNWQRFSIVGHSMGSALGLLFASAYPEKVTHIVNLDYLYPTNPVVDLMPCPLAVDYFFQLEDRIGKVDEFIDEDEALDYILKTRLGLPRRSAAAILDRCKKIQYDGSCVITNDPRSINFHLIDFAYEDVFEELENIKAHFLLIRAKLSPTAKTMHEQQAKTREILRRKCQSYKEVELPGMHFIHAENPLKCAQLIKSFLSV